MPMTLLFSRVLFLGLAFIAAPCAAQTIELDIGHSVASPGSKAASGRTEFVYNQALGLEIARYLRSYGYRVNVPNQNGAVRGLVERSARGYQSGASLFVSIHHDSIQPHLMPNRTAYRGYSVWTSGSHSAAARSTTCGRIIATTMRQAGMSPALFHAQPIKGEGRTLLDASVGHYRRDDLAVLRTSKIPAVLIEAGVIVNPNEEQWLATPAVRDGIARTIATAIATCLS